MNIDYHVEYDGRLYSVPHALVGERVEVRVTNAVVEIFHRGRRVASHARLWGPQGHGQHHRRASAALAPRVRRVAAVADHRVGRIDRPRRRRRWSSRSCSAGASRRARTGRAWR